MGKLLALLLVKAAEGDLGPALKTAYWKTAGYKTYIGLAFGAIALLLDYAGKNGCQECQGAAVEISAGIAAVTMYIGQIDVGIRTDPPQNPDEFVKIPAP
jgi:hypothetical protein